MLLALAGAAGILPGSSAQVLISEFMAANSSALADETGAYPDWLEVHNPGPGPVDLDGWFLTDTASRLAKWRFPATNLAAGAYLVVFASEQNRRLPGAPLHTNFKLAANGEYLALVDPQTHVVAEFAPAFPPQVPDVSFGLGSTGRSMSLVSPESTARYLVPADGALGTNWVRPEFNAAGWATGSAAVGYETAPADYASLIRTDLRGLMSGRYASCFLRVPFILADPKELTSLTLRVQFDDGFVAWLNGTLVARRNAPSELAWNASATANHPDDQAVEPEVFDLTPYREWLTAGTNWLACQGLNVSVNSSDFLLVPVLEAERPLTAEPAAWRYFLEPTPGQPNRAGSDTVGPLIARVVHSPPLPAQPHVAQPLTVTAAVAPAFAPVARVQLHYRPMFASEVTVPLHDDGQHEDGAAGDGVYGARLEAGLAAPGELLRYRVTATDAAGRASRWPLFEDARNSPQYLGTVMADPNLASPLPIWQWFAENVAAARTFAGTRGALFFEGQLLDNILVRARGGATSGGSQKFDFNTGHHLLVSESVGRVEEANLNTPGSDPSYLRVPLAYQIFRMAAHDASDAFHVWMQLNGRPDRVGIFIEQVDERFLRRRGLDREGALYKFVQRGQLTPVFSDATDGVEKKTRLTEGRADLQAFVDGLNQADPNRQRAWFFDQVNVPHLLNYLAVRCLIQDTDDVRKNFYLYRDTRGNGEWSIFPWDKDWTLGVTGDGGSSLRHPFFGDYAHRKQNANQWNRLWEFVFNDPVTRPLYLRRLRTVIDTWLQPPGTPAAQRRLEPLARALVPPLVPHLGAGVSNQLSSVLAFFDQRRTDLFVTYAATNRAAGNDALIPESQPLDAAIQFGDLDFNPASGNQAEEFVRLDNPNAFAVDLSHWQLAGAVRHTFRPGTVVGAGQALFVSPEVNAFRARRQAPHGGQGLLVQGNYAGQLSAWGETLELIDVQGRTVAAHTYPGSPSAAQRWLRVTELNVAPLPEPGSGSSAQDFEFIELTNTGPVPLDLAGIRFTAGVQFAFGQGPHSNLEPGGFVLVVRQAAAFARRYGSGLPVAGEFAGQLDNAGENLRLEDAVGEKILEFAYDPAWWTTAAGTGHSLVVVDPTAPWTDWANPLHWRISATVGGSPGRDDPATPLADTDGDGLPDDWERRHGLDPMRDDAHLDLDADGASNFEEYQADTNPRAAASRLQLVAQAQPDGTARLQFHARPGRSYRLLGRATLSSGRWEPLASVARVELDHVHTFVIPLTTYAAQFYRLELVLGPAPD